MDEKFIRRFESFRNSLDSLAEAKQRDLSDSFVLSGTSAKFSITFDLAWKVMKDKQAPDDFPPQGNLPSSDQFRLPVHLTC